MLKSGLMNLILIEQKGEYALVKKLNSSSEPYIVVRELEVKGDKCSWGSGKYFDGLFKAVDYFRGRIEP